MTGIQPSPYLASTIWMRSRGKGMSLQGRDYTRTLVGSNRAEGQVLTVPVEGGSSAVKRGPVSSLRVSGHGDWPRIHLGALEAAYGKEPYFAHLFPEIAEVIADYPESLTELNGRLLGVMLSFAGYADEIEHLRSLRLRHPLRVAGIAGRLEAGCDISHSYLEPLFRFGRDAIFLLLDYDKTYSA
ncbi:MAG: WbqC family protein [Muribaculaceae bacterium]|nr:WbqC family protein [Muribaculaceae bacterium]